MVHEHDFKRFPELRNSQMELHYFQSPHRQIFEDFNATVVKVHDGDTITIETEFRDFKFPLRLSEIDAPELNEEDGAKAQSWLEDQILDQEIMVLVNEFNRVGKWGRLLGEVVFRGVSINEEMIRQRFAVKFEDRDKDKIPDLEEELNIKQWLVPL